MSNSRGATANGTPRVGGSRRKRRLGKGEATPTVKSGAWSESALRQMAWHLVKSGRASLIHLDQSHAATVAKDSRRIERYGFPDGHWVAPDELRRPEQHRRHQLRARHIGHRDAA